MNRLRDSPLPPRSPNVEDRVDASVAPAPAEGARRRGPLRYLGGTIAVTVAALFVALMVYGVLARSPNSTIDDSLARGQAAVSPPFTLPVLQRGALGRGLSAKLVPALVDHRVSVAELRGTPVVLNVWASWCDPCRQEAPILERTWRRAGRPRGVLFLGLDQQDVEGDARRFMRQFAIDYLNVRDGSDEVPRRFGASGVPETYFIDARGKVVDHVVGVLSPSQLRQGMAAARAGRPLGVRDGGARRSAR